MRMDRALKCQFGYRISSKWLTKFHERTDSNIQLSSKQWLRSMFDMSSYHGYLRRAYGIMPDANNIKAEERKAMPKAIETGMILLMLDIHLFPDLLSFWFLEKTTLHENCVSGTVLMFQLTRNSPTNSYIS